MRRFASAFAVASLLGCSLAFAQTASPPGGAGGQNAPPAESPSAAPNASGESTGEHATTSKHMSKKACTKEAKAKQLTGAEKKQFIKDCEHGKTTE